MVDDRDGVAASLKAAGVPTAIYYPRPLHQQPAYATFPHAAGGLSVSERLAARVLSLPMHPYLDKRRRIGSSRALATAVSRRAHSMPRRGDR